MSGVKGRSGRKKKSPSRANAQRRMAQLAPLAVEVMGETVEGKNKDRLQYEAAKDIWEQNFGRAHQSQDLRVSLLKAPSGDDYELGMGWVDREDKKLMDKYGGLQKRLKEGLTETEGGSNNAIQRQGKTEGSSQEGSSEA